MKTRAFLVSTFLVILALGRVARAEEPWNAAVSAADQKIRTFEAAVQSGAPEQAIRDAALEVQADPVAVHRMNTTGSGTTKAAMNQTMAGIRDAAKAKLTQRIVDEYHVPQKRVTVYEAQNPRPPESVKVPQDWDVTARIDGQDIPASESARLVHESYYEAATGRAVPKPPPEGASAEAVKTYELAQQHYDRFTARQPVEPTDRLSPEAYGSTPAEGDAILHGDKTAPVRDPTQLSEAIKYKSNKPGNEAAAAHEAGDHVGAQAGELEQMRQGAKQFREQVKPRVEGAGGRVPEHVQKGMEVLERVEGGAISPSEARAELRGMGETPESITGKSADLIDAAQRLKPPPPPASGPKPPESGVGGAEAGVGVKPAGEGGASANTTIKPLEPEPMVREAVPAQAGEAVASSAGGKPVKAVRGDPALADMVNPEVQHVPKPPSDGVKALVEGKPPSSSAGEPGIDAQRFGRTIEPSEVKMPSGSDMGPKTRAVKGDPTLADLAEPGVKHVQSTGEPELAGLGRGEPAPKTVRSRAETKIGEAPPETETVKAGEKPGGKIGVRKILNTASEVVGGMAVAGQMGEAGTKQMGDVIDENRDFTLGDAGEAIVEGAGIPGMYRLGRDISREEQIRVQKGEQGQAQAAARTALRVGDAMAHDMINDPVDRAIREEEERAAKAGEEPSYVRSAYNAGTDIGGKFTGIGALSEAAMEVTTWDERGDYAAQKAAMGQFVDDNVRMGSRRIRKLQGEIEQLSLNGDLKNPETQAEIQKRLNAMDAEYDKLGRVYGMAQRTLGRADPDKVTGVERELSTLPSRKDFKGYIGQNLADRGVQTAAAQPPPREDTVQLGRAGGAEAAAETGGKDDVVEVAGSRGAEGQGDTRAAEDVIPPVGSAIGAQGTVVVGSPVQAKAGSGSFLDDLKNAARSALGPEVVQAAENAVENVKQRVQDQAITEARKDPERLTRAFAEGLNREDDVQRQVRRMYNAAPEGSDDRKKLNDLFIHVRDAQTPAERAAAEREVAQWGQRYPPPVLTQGAAEEPAAPPAPVTPTRAELEAQRDQIKRDIQEQDDNTQAFTRMGDESGVKLSQWVREQDQHRLDEIERRLQGGEFQQEGGEKSSASTTATTSGGGLQGTTLSTAGTTPATSADTEESAPETASPDEPRSASGYTRQQLETDNWNLQGQAEKTEGRIKDLEQQIKDSRNSTERRELQEELNRQRGELQGVQDRILENTSELFAMGDEPREGEAEPPKHDPQVLQNDNWNMQNLAEKTQNEIRDLQQQIKNSRNSTERRELQEQIDRKKDELEALQQRVNDNNLELMDMGEKPGTGPGPNVSAQDLQNDNWNMQNLAQRTQDEITKLERQIRDCRNSTERRELQEQLDRKRNELAGLVNRVDENNQQLLDMGERPGTGPGPSWTRENLENDNWNMGNLSERLQGEIMDLEAQIAQSHDGSERRRLQEEADRKRDELTNIQRRIEENNQALDNMPPSEGEGEGSDAAAEVFDSDTDGAGGEGGEGDESDTADESSGAGDDTDALRSDEGGSWDESSTGDGGENGSRPLDSYVEDSEAGYGGGDDYSVIEDNSEIADASTAGDEDAEEADRAVDSAGQEAQGITRDSSVSVAASDAQDSWGSKVGSAVIEGGGDGLKQGAQALGERGSAAVTDHAFGEGHAEPEAEPEGGQVADAGQGAGGHDNGHGDDDHHDNGHHDDRAGQHGGGTGHGPQVSATTPASTTPATPQLVRCPKCGRMVSRLVWCPKCNMYHCGTPHTQTQTSGAISFDEETLKKNWESTHDVDRPVSEPVFTP